MTSNIKIKKINTEIASIIIDEQKTYNSLSFKNLTDLLKALKKLDTDKKIKVIILEGAGKGFSAGLNLKEVRGLKKKDKYQKLFNIDHLPEDLFISPGTKAPNRMGFSKYASYINTLTEQKYGRPLILAMSADLSDSTNQRVYPDKPWWTVRASI